MMGIFGLSIGELISLITLCSSFITGLIYMNVKITKVEVKVDNIIIREKEKDILVSETARSLKDTTSETANILKNSTIETAKLLKDNTIETATILRQNTAETAKLLKENTMETATILRQITYENFQSLLLHLGKLDDKINILITGIIKKNENRL